MTTLLADLQALMNIFAGAVGTVGATIVALVVVLGLVSPVYELGRFERRWYEDN